MTEPKWRPHDYETGHSECRRKWINESDFGFWCWVNDEKSRADFCDCERGSILDFEFLSG